MDVGIAIANYLAANPTVAGLLGNRLLIGVAEQGTQYPYATFRTISTVHEHTISNLSGLARSRIEIEVYAKKALEGSQIMSAILKSGIVSFKGLESGFDIRGVQIDNGPAMGVERLRDGKDEHHYVYQVDLIVSFGEEG